MVRCIDKARLPHLFSAPDRGRQITPAKHYPAGRRLRWKSETRFVPCADGTGQTVSCAAAAGSMWSTRPIAASKRAKD